MPTRQPAPTIRARPPDRQRSQVYAAEQTWSMRLDAARLGARRAVVAGSSIVLPVEVRFGSLDAAARYADDLLSRWDVPPVVLRARRGQAKAHWEAPGTVALPWSERGETWAMREAVVLHELAHHLAFHLDGEPGHGPAFPARLLELVGAALGEQAAFVLGVDYAEHRVAVSRG